MWRTFRDRPVPHTFHLTPAKGTTEKIGPITKSTDLYVYDAKVCYTKSAAFFAFQTVS